MNDVRVFAIDGHAETDFEAIGLCANKLAEEGIVKDVFLSNCIEREKSYPTGLPCDPPVAMPHSAASGVISDGICVLRLDSPVKFHRMDDDQETVDVKMVFNLAVTDPQGHLKVLQSLMALFMDHDAMCDLYRSDIWEVPRILTDYLANSQESQG